MGIRIDRSRHAARAMRLLAPLTVLTIAAAACSSNAPAATHSSSAASPSTTAGASSGAASGAASGATVQARTGTAGTYLTDGTGRSLYMFAADSATKSACTGSCLSYWPPFDAAVHAGPGAVQGALGTIVGANGKRQVTYHGHPLYYFSGDSAPGQTNGEGSTGSGAKWWLLTPAGDPLMHSAGSSSAAPGGYGI